MTKAILKNVTLMSLVLSFATSLYATTKTNETTLMITINKDLLNIPNPCVDIQEKINALNHTTPSTGLCYVEAKVAHVVDFEEMDPTGPYCRMVEVDFKWNCDSFAQELLSKINDDAIYTVWPNGDIDPLPAVSGSN